MNSRLTVNEQLELLNCCLQYFGHISSVWPKNTNSFLNRHKSLLLPQIFVERNVCSHWNCIFFMFIIIIYYCFVQFSHILHIIIWSRKTYDKPSLAMSRVRMLYVGTMYYNKYKYICMYIIVYRLDDNLFSLWCRNIKINLHFFFFFIGCFEMHEIWNVSTWKVKTEDKLL